MIWVHRHIFGLAEDAFWWWNVMPFYYLLEGMFVSSFWRTLSMQKTKISVIFLRIPLEEQCEMCGSICAFVKISPPRGGVSRVKITSTQWPTFVSPEKAWPTKYKYNIRTVHFAKLRGWLKVLDQRIVVHIKKAYSHQPHFFSSCVTNSLSPGSRSKAADNLLLYDASTASSRPVQCSHRQSGKRASRKWTASARSLNESLTKSQDSWKTDFGNCRTLVRQPHIR